MAAEHSSGWENPGFQQEKFRASCACSGKEPQRTFRIHPEEFWEQPTPHSQVFVLPPTSEKNPIFNPRKLQKIWCFPWIFRQQEQQTKLDSNSSISSCHRELEFPNGQHEQEVKGAGEGIQGIPAAIPNPLPGMKTQQQSWRENIPEFWKLSGKDSRSTSLGWSWS